MTTKDDKKWCSRCHYREAKGWENGWRLRLCFDCESKLLDCNGRPLDFSPDNEAEWAEWQKNALANPTSGEETTTKMRVQVVSGPGKIGIDLK